MITLKGDAKFELYYQVNIDKPAELVLNLIVDGLEGKGQINISTEIHSLQPDSVLFDKNKYQGLEMTEVHTLIGERDSYRDSCNRYLETTRILNKNVEALNKRITELNMQLLDAIAKRD